MKNESILYIALLFLFSGSTCGKEEKAGACKSGREHINISRFIRPNAGFKYINWDGTTTVDGPGDEIRYQRNIGNKVSFYILHEQVNICTKSHIIMNYYCDASDETQPLNLKIYGEGYWESYHEKVLLHDGISTPGAKYSKIFEFGLKQAFQDNPGDIEFYLTVEFDRHATLQGDIEYFEKHIAKMSMSYDYDLHN